jgi:hypothetical protein
MPGDKLFDPSSSLAIRDPQDNGNHSGKIVNPPRYMEFGGLTSGGVRGIVNNMFKVLAPGSTISKVPLRKNGKF